MRVAVCGLGKMGAPIARRLLAAGHALTVYNRTPGRADPLVAGGAREVRRPDEVWGTADVCLTMVADDTALAALTTGEAGLLLGPPPERVLVDMSTVSPAASAEVARAAEGAGVAYLRAPVSGNPSVVEAGNLTIMVSGDERAYRRVEGMLRDVGPHLFYLGQGEEARVMKLALQVVIAGTAELMAEALVLAEAGGLERAAVLEVMGQSAVGSPFVKYKTPALVANDFTATFTAAAMHKDLSLVLDAGRALGVPLPVVALVHQHLQACMSSGMADIDLMALLPRLQREAGKGPAVEDRG